jgi:hypothetical protein
VDPLLAGVEMQTADDPHASPPSGVLDPCAHRYENERGNLMSPAMLVKCAGRNPFSTGAMDPLNCM